MPELIELNHDTNQITYQFPEKIVHKKYKQGEKASRCKTCGMELLPYRVKRENRGVTRITTVWPEKFCDKICKIHYDKSPGEFGLWWNS